MLKVSNPIPFAFTKKFIYILTFEILNRAYL